MIDIAVGDNVTFVRQNISELREIEVTGVVTWLNYPKTKAMVKDMLDQTYYVGTKGLRKC